MIINITLLMVVAITLTSVQVSQATELVTKSNSKFSRDRASLIAQKDSQITKAQEYNKLAFQKFLNSDFKGALADLDRAIQL
jgi:uncharacterized protein YycO